MDEGHILSDLHRPLRHGIERGRPDRLTGSQRKTGMVPGAPDRIPDDHPFGQWSAVVGAGGADCEHLISSPHEHDRFVSHVAAERLPLRQSR
jgi:hypothetical protein